MVWIYLLFAFAAGAVLPFQAGVNAELAGWLHSPVRAAFVSFLVGTILLLVAAALVFKPLPSWGRLGHAPWWVWIGGALGAFYVVGSIVSAPKLGAATLVTLVVAGQGAASCVVDHFGWVGFEPRHVTFGRLVGIALVGGGVLRLNLLARGYPVDRLRGQPVEGLHRQLEVLLLRVLEPRVRQAAQ